jgi:hypothetical protein
LPAKPANVLIILVEKIRRKLSAKLLSISFANGAKSTLLTTNLKNSVFRASGYNKKRLGD